MMNFQIVDDGTLVVTGALLVQKVQSQTQYWGVELHRSVIQHASGHPGPEVRSGRYLSTIQLSHDSNGVVARSEVFTDAPFGARLEYGFSGEDSNGKHQFSPPYPHFRPALEEIEPRFLADMNGLSAI